MAQRTRVGEQAWISVIPSQEGKYGEVLGILLSIYFAYMLLFIYAQEGYMIKRLSLNELKV